LLGWNAHGQSPGRGDQPRPTNGILLAMTVMKSTFVSSGIRAMQTTAFATFSTSIVGSIMVVPLGCGTPLAIRSVIGVAALRLPTGRRVWSSSRPSGGVAWVGRVLASWVAVYGAESGRGVCAEIEPLLMIRPPRGFWSFMILKASCVHRNEPVRFVSTTAFHC